MNKRIFITGASSGIGEHLAYAYAKKGVILGLAARRLELLTQVAEKCRELGSKTYVYQLDLKSQQACKETANQFIVKSGGIDIVIANAGIAGEDQLSSGDASAINDILTTNIVGVTNTLIPFIPTMKEQHSGVLVNLCSAASFTSVLNYSGYCGSKRSTRFILNNWRLSLSNDNIQISNICPGFIETPMTEKAQDKDLIFLLPVKTAVKKIIGAIDKGKKNFIFPWQLIIGLLISKIIPQKLLKLVYNSSRVEKRTHK